jgi:hypothetical protein
MATIAVAALALSLAAVVNGPQPVPVHVEPEVTFALPSASSGCAGDVLLPGGAERMPLTVSTVAGQVAETVEVCFGTQGPFPFVLDSGAEQSTIDAGLARRLHLAAAGPEEQFAGVGCTGTARPVSVAAWSLEGVSLAPQQLTAATLPQIGGKAEPMGLLGADVLSRFGAVRIDFAAGALVVPGAEGSEVSAATPYTGPIGPPPVALTHGEGTTVPVTVAATQSEVALSVAVRFAGGHPRSFDVDTGSSQSVVSTVVAHEASLAGTRLAQRQSTVCSVITVPLVHSGTWSVPGEPLHRQLVGETDFGTIGQGGLDGLLGSDQLRRFGWIVLDYTGGRLVLG